MQKLSFLLLCLFSLILSACGIKGDPSYVAPTQKETSSNSQTTEEPEQTEIEDRYEPLNPTKESELFESDLNDY